MGFSNEEYIDMYDKMMAELNEAEFKKGLHNLFAYGEECYKIGINFFIGTYVLIILFHIAYRYFSC